MRLLLNTLAAGSADMPPAKGIVWTIGVGQGSQNLGPYKGFVQQWLQDAPFWADMAKDVAVTQSVEITRMQQVLDDLEA